MKLKDRQIDELARLLVGMVDSIREFYDNPQNQKAYREWYLKKFGCLPPEEKVVT